MPGGDSVLYANKNELAVGDTSQQRRKSSLRSVHPVSVGNDRDDRWPSWARLMVVAGAALGLWGVIAVVWLLVAG